MKWKASKSRKNVSEEKEFFRSEAAMSWQWWLGIENWKLKEAK